MKFRTLTAILILCLSSLLFTGCGGEASGITLASTWDKNEAVTYEYALSFTAGESTCGYAFSLTEGSFTTTLTPITVAATGEKQYRYATRLTVSGAYTKGEEVIPFTDVTETITLLHDINTYSMFPISSEKVIKQHSVYPNQASSDYEVREYNFKSTTAYDHAKKRAGTTFYAYNEETGKYDAEVEGIPAIRSYTKLKAASFFDNDALTFVLRAMPLAPEFSASLSTLDVVNAKKQSLYVTAASAVTAREYTIEGVATSLDVLGVTARIDGGTASGKPYTLYYAPMEGAAVRNILTEMQTYLPYGMGTLTYSLTKM